MPEKPNKTETPAYKSGKPLAIPIQILLALTCIGSVLIIFFDLGGVIATLPSNTQKPDSSSILEGAQLLIDTVEGIGAIAFLSCAVFFLVWIRRLRRNLQYFGINDLITKNWHCTWGFAIPILCLFKPYRAIQEIWRASSLTSLSERWQSHSGTALISWWWGFWLIMNATARISDKIKTVDAQGHIDIPAYTVYFTASAINEVLTFVAAVLAFIVVTKLTNKQEMMYKTLPAQNEVPE
ncbi:MAG: DUF4328 domain-containing protein [Candidatus Obscuribacter sp.]|nr:DUF4328 domain-containing protein [Candidatus Obscuribacter sp.]MBK9621134.1 DUF4328 domain-containing protein [Candidatus Obscuribacter sp.]